MVAFCWIVVMIQHELMGRLNINIIVVVFGTRNIIYLKFNRDQPVFNVK